MKFEGLWLRGLYFKHKEPAPYDFNGRRGVTYTIFLDSGDNVYELKVPEEVYNSLRIGCKYVFECSCNIDRSNKENNNFIVRSVVKSCAGNDDFSLSLLSELSNPKSGKAKADSNTQPETK